VEQRCGGNQARCDLIAAARTQYSDKICEE
jgi:hypothetical protein